MDFKDQIKQISERIDNLKESLYTEEATKNALIMPFISALGYDVFNPLEVLPEIVCDIGTKKGEKVDYAILMNGEPVILIECKHCEQDLNLHDNQLLRYFNVSKAKFGILTNGIIYRFYSDLLKRAINSHINDIISNRLKSAIQDDEPTKPQTLPNEEQEESDAKGRIETTEEEIEGFLIVKAIIRSVLPAERITWRDTQSYFGVLADDNNRKPICRLHFNRSQKYISIFDEEKTETKHKIDSLDDIFKYEEELKAIATTYSQQTK